MQGIHRPIGLGVCQDIIYLHLGAQNSSAFCVLANGLDFDGIEGNPAVICGFSVKLPQDATSAERFWNMIMGGKCAMTEFPPDRLCCDGFYSKASSLNSIPLRGGHFLKHDISEFDAGFFSISASEASSMDPMQRMLLEVAYEAFENAGITMEDISGSRTGVYVGNFSIQDYTIQMARDPEYAPVHAAVGSGLSMLANRISWFYNLHGPSIGVDSACSSGMMALDIACQALRSGACERALVAGCNVTMSPEFFVWLSNMDFLSPESRCYSFDHRANGYARGEGVVVIVLSRLSLALDCEYTIRAVIRSTASNEDGRTSSITQPSQVAQERLIRETYDKEGLSMQHTRFFEAHGTGTPVGDPIEAQAIGSVFRQFRSPGAPLYVGAVKSNIGHLEGASGLAGIVKTVMVLEKGIIPPNANFVRLNDRIDADFLRLEFPDKSRSWPIPGLRRASVNSFGYGGANSHVVLDDAFSYLTSRALQGKHNTTHEVSGTHDSAIDMQPQELPKLLVWSAADDAGIARFVDAYDAYFKQASLPSRNTALFLDNLAYTLTRRRTHLRWRSFAVLRASGDLARLPSLMSVPIKSKSSGLRVGFVFSGQGAQWSMMGKELLLYPTFSKSLEKATEFLGTLGCNWSVIDELLKPAAESLVDDPEFSQILCTVLQIALVDLLRLFGVQPSAVVGHSSGEIAAAYASGHLCRESAWKIAYFRGIYSAELANCATQHSGAMLAAALSEKEAGELVDSIGDKAASFGICIACINSPRNVTISGEATLIDDLVSILDKKRIFARRLRVPVAYHSRQMESIALKYMEKLSDLSDSHTASRVPMISSVTGQQVETSTLLEAQYWSHNMVSPVLFSHAIKVMCGNQKAGLTRKIDCSHASAPVDHILEVGPHAVLQAPIREIFETLPLARQLGYSSVLKRGQSATQTMLEAAGQLHCLGLRMAFCHINLPATEYQNSSTPSLLVDLPSYPFNHSRRYWYESRLSRNYRLRSHAPLKLLGARTPDWDPSDGRWRHFLRTSELPWVEDHVVDGNILYPASGMVVMAIEASKQLVKAPNVTIRGYTLRDVHIKAPLNLTANKECLEVQTSLKKSVSLINAQTFEFAIKSFTDDKWTLNCFGIITVELCAEPDDTAHWLKEKDEHHLQRIKDEFLRMESSCGSLVDPKAMFALLEQSGLEYGPAFQALQTQPILFDKHTKHTVSEISTFKDSDSHLIHPVTLDALLRLAYIGFTAGVSRPMPMSIPSLINYMWISAKGLNSEDCGVFKGYSAICEITKTGYSCNGGALSSDHHQQLSQSSQTSELRVCFRGLEMTNVSTLADSLSIARVRNPRQFLMKIDCKVSLKSLTDSEVHSLLDRLHPPQEDLIRSYRDLSTVSLLALRHLNQTIISSSLQFSKKSWQRRYLAWAQYHIATQDILQPALDAGPSFNQLCVRMAEGSPAARTYAAVATNLVELMQDKVEPLELLMQTGLLKSCYEEWSQYRCSLQAASYLDLLAHQNPGMALLEVGGGTAATTRRFLRTLSSGEAGSLRCKRYDFTDVSSAFLSQARLEFTRFQEQMTFKALDLEQELDAQGFELGAYDVVVADNVIHVAENLATTLRNVRKALKSGGKLLMQEILKPSGWTAGFVFGLFPGWWKGNEEDRALSPNIGVDEWDALLKQEGFSGVDLLFRDTDDDEAHHLGWIVATAVEAEGDAKVNLSYAQIMVQATIILDRNSVTQLALSKSLQEGLRDYFQHEPRVLTMKDISVATTREAAVTANTLVILLFDCGASSFLASVETEASWGVLKSLVSSARHLLWATGGGGVPSQSTPDHGMLDGLARTLRSEDYELHLVTLALDFKNFENDLSLSAQATYLLAVSLQMLSRKPHEVYDQEYIELDGMLRTRRLIEAYHEKYDMDQRLHPFQKVTVTSDGHTHFKVECTGPDNSLQYHSVLPDDTGLDEDAVEIEVKAVSLQSQDKALVLSFDYVTNLGTFCAGVITRVGADVKSLQEGDRVIAAQVGSYQSHIRAPVRLVARIPYKWSFVDACATVPPHVAAYIALMDICKFGEDESVLVHDGASPIGKAALQLLSRSGQHGPKGVWATARNQEECDEICEETNIPSHHVLPTNWFSADSISASPYEKQFDILLNPYAQKNTELALLRCLKDGGKSVQITHGPHSLTATRDTTMAMASVLIVDWLRAITQESLYYATTVPFTSIPSTTATFDGGDTDGVSETLRSLDPTRSLVVNMDQHIIDLQIPNSPTFIARPDRTYVIAGGLGGLGQEIARWLTARGAKFMILLSRSGPRTPETREFVSTLQSEGVCLQTPACDISNAKSLASVLSACANSMPPIVGCIQAAMVMTEQVFAKLSFYDWKKVTNPKVKGTWNLHAQLPDDLDFFVIMSSGMGVLGTGSLAAYNAANTYQDSLARYRVSCGQHAVSLDLGAISDRGYLVQQAHQLLGSRKSERYVLMHTAELFALLDRFCSEALVPRIAISDEDNLTNCQVVVGISPPAHWTSEEVPQVMEMPFWGHLHHLPAPVSDGTPARVDTCDKRNKAADMTQRLTAAGSLSDSASIVTEALANHVSTLIGTPAERLDMQTAMHSYGLDSLSAIGLRNWVMKVFDVDVPIFEIMGGATFEAVGMDIARKFMKL
ncbi:putative polyketide synthase [Nemania abortiva]|nr:putative polyketide synthase [Nemania abortiva]